MTQFASNPGFCPRRNLSLSCYRLTLRKSVVLLTGGSGLVGGGLVLHLQRSRPGQQVVIISRQPANIPAKKGVTVLAGDLCRSDLGLAPDDFKNLQAQTTEVIHCAAQVGFNLPLEAARAVNLEGTRHLLDFAEQCSGLEKFAHISTLYIAGRRPGRVCEEELLHHCGYFNTYEQSKHEAEALVFERMKRLPIAIYRLSSIIGDSLTGLSRNNYFHSLIRMIPLAADVPVLPGDPTAPVDLIANDWCIPALALLYREHFAPGGLHHLCAGPEGSLSVAELLDQAFGFFNERTGLSIKRPRLVSLEEFAEFKATYCRNGKQGMITVLDTISRYLPHLAVCQPFDTGATGDLLAQRGLQLPAIADFLDRVLDRTVPQLEAVRA